MHDTHDLYATDFAYSTAARSLPLSFTLPQQHPEANTNHAYPQQSLNVGYMSDPNSIRDSDETDGKEISDGRSSRSPNPNQHHQTRILSISIVLDIMGGGLRR
jgi:hypothetical protein